MSSYGRVLNNIISYEYKNQTHSYFRIKYGEKLTFDFQTEEEFGIAIQQFYNYNVKLYQTTLNMGMNIQKYPEYMEYDTNAKRMKYFWDLFDYKTLVESIILYHDN